MTPDTPTLLSCITVICLLFGSYFIFSEPSHNTRERRFWYASPFLSGGISGIFFTVPSILPGLWGLRIGAIFMLLAYGAGWQAIRITIGHRPKAARILIPCAVSLSLSALAGIIGSVHILSSFCRALVITGFNACALYELQKKTTEKTHAENILWNLLIVYTVLNALIVPFVPWLPAPFGAKGTTIWSVTAYNFMTIIEVTVVALALIAIPRERLAALHHKLTLQDPLTGAGNRRALKEWVTINYINKKPIVLLVLDIDHFKSINDACGHATGDKVIISVKSVCEQILPKPSSFFRIGGEEFIAVFPYTTVHDALTTGHKIRQEFTKRSTNFVGQNIEVTLSIGGAIRLSSGTPWLTLLDSADAALYTAKREGRNRIIIAPDSEAPLTAEAC